MRSPVHHQRKKKDVCRFNRKNPTHVEIVITKEVLRAINVCNHKRSLEGYQLSEPENLITGMQASDPVRFMCQKVAAHTCDVPDHRYAGI